MRITLELNEREKGILLGVIAEARSQVEWSLADLKVFHPEIPGDATEEEVVDVIQRVQGVVR